MNLFLLTGILDHKSNENIRYGYPARISCEF
jgi:hypothetical protein